MFEKGIVAKIRSKRDKNGKRGVTFQFDFARKLWAVLPNRRFIPLSETQRTSLENIVKPRGASYYIGSARVRVSPESRHITWETFYPRFKLNRKGIGTRIHSAMVEYLARKFAGHTISHHKDDITYERTEQLKAMGINPSQQYRIEEYRDKVRQYVERRKREGKY